MPGPFYPPPPVFVGGSQPFAGQNTIPQTGQYPTAPIAAATFAAILISWLPGPPPVQGQASPQSYILPAPSQPMVPSHVNLDIIRSSWDLPPVVYWWPLPPGEIVATQPIVNRPPINTHVVFDTIRSSWDQPPPVYWWPLPPGELAATQPIVNPPPVNTRVNLDTIRANWELPPPWWPLPASPPLVQPGPKTVQLAPNSVAYQTIRAAWEPAVWWPLPAAPPLVQVAPANPPPLPATNYNIVIDGWWWDPRPVFKYIGGGDSDGLAASQPPPRHNAHYEIIRAAWEPPVWWPLPALRVFPIAGPAVIVPPPPFDPKPNLQIAVASWDDSTWTVIFVPSIGSQFNPPQPFAPQPHLIRSAWDLPWGWAEYRQGAANIAPLVPAISAPPPLNAGVLSSIIAANQPPWYAIPPAGVIASTLPAPSQPVPTQSATLRIVLQAWDLPPPAFVYQPGLAPFIVPPSQPVPVQSAHLRVILQAWDAPPPDFVYPPGLASQTIPPSQPAPVSVSGLMQLLDSWRDPVWWPLPQVAQQPQSAPLVPPPAPIILPFPLRKYLVPPTIINPDAVSYVGPQPQVPIQPPFPRWMYNPVLPPVIVVNLAQQNALIALGTGWTVAYQPPYPAPNTSPQSVSAMVPTGTTDNFAPQGAVPGFTSRFLLTPTDATSTLAGLVAAGDGWMIEIINPSTTLSLTLLNNASLKAGNSFVLPTGNQVVIPAQRGNWFQWVAAVNGWMLID